MARARAIRWSLTADPRDGPGPQPQHQPRWHRPVAFRQCAAWATVANGNYTFTFDKPLEALALPPSTGTTLPVPSPPRSRWTTSALWWTPVATSRTAAGTQGHVRRVPGPRGQENHRAGRQWSRLLSTSKTWASSSPPRAGHAEHAGSWAVWPCWAVGVAGSISRLHHVSLAELGICTTRPASPGTGRVSAHRPLLREGEVGPKDPVGVRRLPCFEGEVPVQPGTLFTF